VYIHWKRESHILYETITSASASFFLLELNEFKLAKWFEDILQICFSDAEVDVTNIEAMERHRAMIGSSGFWVAGLTILLCFSELGDDGDSKKLLACHSNGSRYRVLAAELNIPNTTHSSVRRLVEGENQGLPFGATTHTILDDLCLLDGTNLLKESDQLFGAQTSRELLDEDGSPVALIFGQLRFRCLFFLDVFAGTARASALMAIAISSVIITAGAWAIVAIISGRARAAAVSIIVTVWAASLASISTATAVSASMTSISGAALATWASQVVIISAAVVFAGAAASSTIAVAGIVSIVISLTAFSTFGTVAVNFCIWRFAGGSWVKESLDIESWHVECLQRNGWGFVWLKLSLKERRRQVLHDAADCDSELP
jgi:hypothetical protein